MRSTVFAIIFVSPLTLLGTPAVAQNSDLDRVRPPSVGNQIMVPGNSKPSDPAVQDNDRARVPTAPEVKEDAFNEPTGGVMVEPGPADGN